MRRALLPAALLLMVIHHLVVDGVSWRILVENLQVGCEQVLGGGAVELGAKTTSFQRCSRGTACAYDLMIPSRLLARWCS